jgi:hypothetical protein
LLDAGASANTGWYERNHQPTAEWESAIYGAAGVAHHADLTRLLLERGADPNDEETPYHAPETWDNAALKVLVESGKLTEDSLTTILLRKTDWHDYEGIKWLLERGVDPNRASRWGKTALHNAVLSDNRIEIIQVLLDHGADPTLVANRPDRSPSASPGKSAIAIAARRGRGDILDLFEKRGIPIVLDGVERLIAACARNDAPGIRSMVSDEPRLVRELQSEGGKLLAQFAGHRSEDARPHGLVLFVDQHRRVVVELDVRPVLATIFLHGADDDRLHDRTLLDRAIRRSFFDRGGDDIAQPGVLASGGTAAHLDRRDLLGAGVVGDGQYCSHLNHD